MERSWSIERVLMRSFLFPKGYSRGHLVEAVKGTGHAFFEIGKLFDEQPKQDWEPLGDFLHVHKGVISAFPEIFTNHKVTTIL